jgi:hypothetical protein
MKMWAQNELEPQVRHVNVEGCESALFLLTHSFMQTFMSHVYDLHGRTATKAFLTRFVDGRRKHQRFALIAKQMHEMRNVMAHQLYSSLTHDIVFDYRLEVGWLFVADVLHINPKQYGDQFIAAIDGGRLAGWRKYTNRLSLARQKYRFIMSWLRLSNDDPLRAEIERLVRLPDLAALRAAEKSIRSQFRHRYDI